MNRIIVIGCPGAGKSVFSRALHRATGIPLIHLDALYWKADGTQVERERFLRRLSEALTGDRWIIDGNYNSTMELRLRACDAVFFLDYPAEVCLSGVAERRGKPRSDMPSKKADDGSDEAFLQFIRRYGRESRPAVLALLERYSEKEIHVFRGRAEADAYLRGLSGNTGG